MAKCKICDNEIENVATFTDKSSFDCTHCGKYILLESMSIDIDIFKNRKKDFYKVSSYIYEQNREFKNIPEINENKFKELLNKDDKKIKEKFDLMMIYLSKLSTNYFREDDLIIKCWIKDYEEFFLLLERAIEVKLIIGKVYSTGGHIFTRLTFEGLNYIESIEYINKDSRNIFVAFNFKDSLEEIFNNNLKTSIEKEGFNYIVVNQNNVDHNKSINDEIIVKLKSSRIVIADFTNHRNSVYFEAGFAMGMNIPIIWTCQEGHANDMSFDTRQFPHIIWKDKDDLVKQVIDRIKVII
ncbi:MAG: hypothetical protein HRT42_13150 [Campylobacteraceae bacterium]|nr:hypothetical protein [Campylobacteraceae bacterium]